MSNTNIEHETLPPKANADVYFSLATAVDIADNVNVVLVVNHTLDEGAPFSSRANAEYALEEICKGACPPKYFNWDPLSKFKDIVTVSKKTIAGNKEFRFTKLTALDEECRTFGVKDRVTGEVAVFVNELAADTFLLAAQTGAELAYNPAWISEKAAAQMFSDKPVEIKVHLKK